MTLILPNPPDRYDPVYERARNDALTHADQHNFKIWSTERIPNDFATAAFSPAQVFDTDDFVDVTGLDLEIKTRVKAPIWTLFIGDIEKSGAGMDPVCEIRIALYDRAGTTLLGTGTSTSITLSGASLLRTSAQDRTADVGVGVYTLRAQIKNAGYGPGVADIGLADGQFFGMALG